MWKSRPSIFVVLSVACVCSSFAVTAQQKPETCPVTRPYQDGSLFVPPSPYPQNPGKGNFWYGSDKLWTALPVDGTWRGLPHYTPDDPTFRQKLAFYRQGYTAQDQPQPPRLSIMGRRLDAATSKLGLDSPNTVWHDDPDHSFIMTAVNFWALGCWEIKATYKDDEIKFVVRVAK